MSEVRLPDLGDVEMVRIVEWLKRVGDTVAIGDELVEVETEKTVFVVEADRAGRLQQIVSAANDHVRTGDVLAHIEADDH